MKGNLPCTPEIRKQNCTEGSKGDWFSSYRYVDGDRAASRICLGCPILKLMVDGKSQEDIANSLRMDAHTVGEFMASLYGRLVGWGWGSQQHIIPGGKVYEPRR